MKTIFQQMTKTPDYLFRSICLYGVNDEGSKYQQEDSSRTEQLLLVVTLLMDDGEQQKVNDLVGRGYTSRSARKKKKSYVTLRQFNYQLWIYIRRVFMGRILLLVCAINNTFKISKK